jgi:polysaccharide chain length determinant protein (PEP-CTERM system associated)
MLWKQKRPVLLIWLVLSMGAAGVIYRLPAVYRAETLILVESQKVPEKYVTATVHADVQDRLATISQQILSSTRLQKIIDDFGLYREERSRLAPEEVIERMRQDIEVKLEKGWTQNRPGAFRIVYRGETPALVAEVANRLANLYIEENLRAREVQAEGTTEFIDNQLQQAKKGLDELEASVSRYKLQHNGELPQQENSLIGMLARLQIKLQGNQDAWNRAEQNRQMLENALAAAEASEAALRSALAQRAQPAAATAPGPPGPAPSQPRKSETLEQELEALRARYHDDHPEVGRLAAEVARLRSTEQQNAPPPEQAPPASAPAVPVASSTHEVQNLLRERERVASLRAQLAAATRELQLAREEREGVLRQIASTERRIQSLPIREQEMAALLRDYEISKANYKSLLEKKLAADMATELERRQKGERFTVLDPARVPVKPFRPNRPAWSAVGTLAALAAALAFGLARELQKNSVLGEWELPPGAVILARVPYMH